MTDYNRAPPNRRIQFSRGAVTDGEIRYDDNGLLDEIVGTGFFHLERMDATTWFLDLGGARLYLHLQRKHPVPDLFEVEP